MVLTWILLFFGTRPYSKLLLYSHGFYPFPVLTWILPFPVLSQTLFPYLPRFYPSLVLARILHFSSTRPNSILLRYSLGFNLSQYSLGPFLGTRTILPFSGTRPDSTILLYSPRLYLSQYSPGLYFSSILAQILPFFGTSLDSTILWYSPRYYLSRYSPRPFFGTCPDSTLFRYSPGFYLSPVLA